MNICYVITSLGTGGAEKLVVELANKLSEYTRVRIISISGDRGIPYNILNKNNVELIELNIKNLYNPLIAIYIKKYTKGFDIIHTNTFYAQLYSSILIKNSKLITTEHNTNNRRRGKLIFKIIDSLIYYKHKKIICISEGTKEELIKWCDFTKNKTVVINNGINLEKYKSAKPLPREELGLLKNDFVVTCVGSLSIQKNHIELIESIKNIKNIKLLLVGEGKERENIERKISNLKLENKIKLLGIRSDIDRILKSSDAFILLSKWEGFGLVAVEAAASGLPLIISDVKGLGNLFEDSEVFKIRNNYYYEIKKAIDIIKKYNRNNKKFRYSMLYKYSIENMIKQYLEEYDKI